MMSSVALQDRPIERSEDDVLDRGPFVDSLVRALVREQRGEDGRIIQRRSTGYVVGLTGKWGSGKSSILNLLELRLGSMSRVVVANFNPWLFKGRDELVSGFFQALRGAMGNSEIEDIRELASAVDKYWEAIDFAAHGVAALVDVSGGGGAATASWMIWKSRVRAVAQKPKPRSPDEERKALEQKLKDKDVAVVVLIDELDRVEDEEVRAVAQLVKAVGSIKGLSYLVAYDPKRVMAALGGGDGERGAAYLEKIVQHAIPLRPLLERDIEMLLEAGIAAHVPGLRKPANEHEQEILDELKRAVSTPREVKRLFGAFAILEEAVRGEINPYDVLGYCWLLTKAQPITDAISENPDKVASDASASELSRRLTRRMDGGDVPVTVEGDLGEAAKPHSAMLKLLFPRFGRADGTVAGDHIAKRRNLVRLLYLGNPPGMVRRQEIERLWRLPDANVVRFELSRLRDQGELRPFLDRLDDLMPQLPAEGDAGFWLALARLLVRDSDWIKPGEDAREIAEDATALLIQFGVRDRRQAPRMKAILAALVENGDLVLAPQILRKHLLANGMSRHGSSSSEQLVLSTEETRNLWEQERSRYREAVLSGYLFKRIPNAEAMYAISNMAEWDEDLRTSVTAQFDHRDAFTTLAMLTVPPGHGIELSFLQELLDLPIALSRLESLRASDNWPTDPILGQSLGRLLLSMRGKDSFFDKLEDEDVE